jgi:diguanylate cyclase (GGDEF)-like protein
MGMMRLDPTAQWHWEQDASLRFLPVAADPGLAASVCASFTGRSWAELPALNMGRADWHKHLQLLYAHEPFFNLELELELPQAGEGRLWVALSGVPVLDAAGSFRGYRGVGRDISQHKRAEATIASLALNDQLTGLANRRLLLERLHSARLASARSQESGALLFVDIDNFKRLNHSLGHAAADLLLKEMGQRLLDCMREYHTVARLGGDVFVVLATSLGQGSELASQSAQTIVKKLAAALERPFANGDTETDITCSMGICLFDGADAPDTSVEQIFKRAEIALRQAKQEGTHMARYFDPVIEAQVNYRSQIERALGLALASEQLRVFYQPIVDVQRQVIGYEALVRWSHPELGMVGPDLFIAVAEQSGLIVPMGEWVIAMACQQLVAFEHQPGRAQQTIAVNLSARQLAQPELVDNVKRLLHSSGAPAHRLKLEITESMLLTDIDKTIEKLHELTRLGIRFSLDDFGTGYSSLSYLKKLPLSQLKIDQSFVRELLTDPVDAAIVKTILQLARSLGMSVIAEGVELEGQRKVLADMGCREFQGYLFGKPNPMQ